MVTQPLAFSAFQPPLAFAVPVPTQPRREPRDAAPRRTPAQRLLGNEPPLDLQASNVPATRHALSLRWLGACVLTALAGTLLLGAAIYVSSEGETTFADAAEPATPVPTRDAGASGGGLRKGDKLVRAETVASAKQIFKSPMTIRSGDRERIVTRSFTRIATGLSLTSGVYATNIPAFNPMRFFAASDAERNAEPPPELSEAEVSVVKTDLSTLLLEPAGPALRDEDVAAQIGAEAQAAAESGRSSPIAMGFGSPAFLPRAVRVGEAAGGTGLFARGVDTSLRSIEVRVVPENVSNVPKSAKGGTSDLAFEDRTVPVKRGDTLEALLRANGAGPEEARTIVTVLGGRDRAVEGLQLRLLLAPPNRPGEPRAVVRAVLYGERGIEAIAAVNDRGSFVSVAPPPVEAARPDPRKPASDEDDEDEAEGSGARLYDSLYETLAKQDLSRQTVEDLIRIFGYDIDFQRRVSQGDGLELFFANDDEAGAERPEILSATLSVGTDMRRVFRFQGEDGAVDYFDEAGRSLKKFLVRKPVAEARISSGFGARFHPILGYAKMHTGVDWAAKAGTPIFAAGNGTVVKAGWDSGYGRRTEVQHANGYVTAYNHQSAFARGLAPGVRVRQGQVIGYVGSTGLSTGAHLHYEVIVNGRFVDPMKIRVPRGRELDGRALADFSRQREQIESILRRSSGGGNQVAASEAR